MLGATDLKLNIKWKFAFTEYGNQCHAQWGTVFADVGGKIDYGIIDHHTKDISPYNSAASVISQSPHYILNHLLGPINETYYRGLEIKNRELTFTYITHNNPDWDGVASFYLCNYIVQNGMLPPKKITGALCTATEIIDQGKAKKDNDIKRPFMIFTAMCYIENSWENRILKGNKLIEDIISYYGTNINYLSFLEPFDSDLYREEYDQLLCDRIHFDRDLENSYNFDIFIPTQTKDIEHVSAIAFKDTPKSKIAKYWVREDTDYKVLLVPYKTDGNITRVVISTDPNFDYVLPCLGYELEIAETQKRARIGKVIGGPPRFEREYSNNRDPWYDGRNHGFTIVDSPGQGTVLSYDEIVNVVKSLYGLDKFKSTTEKKIDAFLSYRRSGGIEIAWAIKTFLDKKNKTIFLDYDTLKTGRFDSQILDAVRKSKCFLLILSPGSLDKCGCEDDWVYREIKEALNEGIKIVPIFKDGFDYKELINLPDEIKELANFHGISINYEYFYATMEKINLVIEELLD